jgi:fructose-bisphosphate aldolase class II
MKAPWIQYFEKPRNPLPGNVLFEALQPPDSIILAANPRLTIDVIVGILQAAKDDEQIVILELALSETNLNGGYTGLTPSDFAERVRQAAEIVNWYGYVLHADHITVKNGDEEELENVKKEIDARVKAGFSSYAIDTSFLFDRNAANIRDQLREVQRTSIHLFKYLKSRMGKRQYGREGEVGEIGITEYTTVEEALHFLNALKREGIDLDCLAIANGSRHGVNVDARGVIIPQLGINIKRTIEIADAIKRRGFRTGIAQHGITGTPFPLIGSRFPKGKINKGNVGTLWMLIVWDILAIFDPELYSTIYDWVISKYGKSNVPETTTFANNSKYSISFFFDKFKSLSKDTKRAIRAKAYAEALTIFEAFGMNKTAHKVYQHIIKKGVIY